jgi:hypothetical protein
MSAPGGVTPKLSMKRLDHMGGRGVGASARSPEAGISRRPALVALSWRLE